MKEAVTGLHILLFGALLLSCLLIAALAADAAAPTAPAVQPATQGGIPFEWASALTGAFSGLLGGIVPAFVAYRMGKKNIEASLAINAAKIEADKEALNKNHKNQIEKLRYEERRKLCFDFLSATNPITLSERNLDFKKIATLHSMILMSCRKEYCGYIRNITELLMQNKARLLPVSLPLDRSSSEFLRIASAMQSYPKFFNILLLVTEKMFNNEAIIPASRWNLDDFEGSVPLDYRKLIS